MVTVFYSSDTHFRHAMVAEMRGFASREEHDQALVDAWNAVVRPSDMVWHLGDVGLGNELAVLACATHLNGVKHLVTGNHDPVWPGHRDSRKRQHRWLDAFESVQAFAKTRIDGRTVLLSHLPYLGAGDHTAEERHTQFRLHDEGAWLIHGHTHSRLRLDGPRSVHVGLDAWGLRPVPEGEIAALIRGAEEKAAPGDPEPCRGFRWIGQSFACCDGCGKPAWEHEGEMRLREGAGPFGGDGDWELRPWRPGEADAIKRKWGGV